jgi:hypothetical protein
MGANAGEQMLSRAMDAESRAQAMEYQAAAEQTAANNKALQDIMMARDYMRQGLNPKTLEYNPFLIKTADTFGEDIVKNIYDWYLTRAGYQPGGSAGVAPVQVEPGAPSRIPSFFIAPPVPSAYTSKVLAPSNQFYTESTLPRMRAGVYTPSNQQKTRD